MQQLFAEINSDITIIDRIFNYLLFSI